MLTNDGNRLRRRDIVTRIPILFARRIKVLLDDLLPP